jgi:hypothetical protein
MAITPAVLIPTGTVIPTGTAPTARTASFTRTRVKVRRELLHRLAQSRGIRLVRTGLANPLGICKPGQGVQLGLVHGCAIVVRQRRSGAAPPVGDGAAPSGWCGWGFGVPPAT